MAVLVYAKLQKFGHAGKLKNAWDVYASPLFGLKHVVNNVSIRWRIRGLYVANTWQILRGHTAHHKQEVSEDRFFYFFS